MKKITLILVCYILLQQTKAQINDIAVKTYSTGICNCVDTLNLNKPQAEIIKSFNLCKSISLANLLNKRLITAETVSDKQQYGALEKSATTELLKECAVIKKLVAAVSKVPNYREKNAEDIFTAPSYFKAYGLLPGEANNRLHVYNSDKMNNAKYQRLVDIRWTFETEEDALAWHEKKLIENAENGEPVKELILVNGAKALKIFRESNSTLETLKSFGLKQRQHYFLFVYKNIVCKVFVATDDKTESRELVPFVMAALKQLKAVLP